MTVGPARLRLDTDALDGILCLPAPATASEPLPPPVTPPAPPAPALAPNATPSPNRAMSPWVLLVGLAGVGAASVAASVVVLGGGVGVWSATRVRVPPTAVVASPPPLAPPAPRAAPEPTPAPVAAPTPPEPWIVTFDRDEVVPTDPMVPSALLACRAWSVTGHTDRVGPAEVNLAIGAARAEAVARALVDRGAASDTITVRSAGESEPADPAPGADADRANRRAVVRCTAPN